MKKTIIIALASISFIQCAKKEDPFLIQNNKIGVLLGVKTKADGGLVQTIYNRKTLRQYVLKSTKADRFKYLLKDLDEAVANGAFGNVNFGDRDLSIREFVPGQTQATTANVNQTDMFSDTDVAAATVADEDDWMN